MPRLVALAIFLSAGIGWIDGYILDHTESRKGSLQSSSGSNGSNLSGRGNTIASLADSESLEEDFSDDESFYFEPLQIPCEVNGFIIPAIVDTGAQVTVMSESCARRCRVADQIDGRFSGKAVGIGSSDILGRINQLSMRVGPISYHSKVSILRQSRVDLIIGLDFLRRFDAEINLERRFLKLNVRGRTVRIPFIPDSTKPLGLSSRNHVSLDDRDSVKRKDERFSESEEDYEFHDESHENVDSGGKTFSPASDLKETQDFMEQKKNLGDSDNSYSRRITRTSSKYEKNEREFVILSSKLNRDYPSDEDDGEDNNHITKSFVSMEGV